MEKAETIAYPTVVLNAQQMLIVPLGNFAREQFVELWEELVGPVIPIRIVQLFMIVYSDVVNEKLNKKIIFQVMWQ